MRLLKAYIFECLLFQKPNDGYPIPNWMIAVVSWFQVLVIMMCVL